MALLPDLISFGYFPRWRHIRMFSFMSKSIPPHNNIAITIVSAC
jgi:hypothetical protein